jgi:hypothetical protein
MKNKYKFLSLTLVVLIAISFFSSCEQREDWRVVETDRGAFVKFAEEPLKWEGLANVNGTTVTKYHIGADPADASFNAITVDPTGNVSNYQIFVKGNFTGAPEDSIPYMSTTSFPFDVSFTTQDMASLFNVDASVFETGDSFDFTTLTTRNDGVVFNSNTSNCDCPEVIADSTATGTTGTWNGGNIDQILLQGGDTGTNALLPAIYWRVLYLARTED